MTRKKTTTGTMGSKRKSTKADKATKAEAAKVVVAPEAKASEVIAPVAIALLAAHPTLPDREEILAAFAVHHVESLARHAALAAQPEPEPEPVKPAGKKPRSPIMPPTLPPMARPVDLGRAPEPVAVVEDALPELDWAQNDAPTESAEVELESVYADELAALEVETYASPAAFEADPYESLEDSPEPAAIEDDPDDFFARLQAEGEAALDGKSSMFEEVDFSAPASTEQSSPFLSMPPPTNVDEGRTTMIEAFPDDEDEVFAGAAAPVVEEEEPAAFVESNESTMMIAAITDEDIEAATAAQSETEDAGAAKGARKSRKSSKKKRG